jgi:hypothetical protein
MCVLLSFRHDTSVFGIPMTPYDTYAITCPHCQRPIECELAHRRCRFCGGDIRKEVWRLADRHSLLSSFGYRIAGLGLGAWGGALLWTIRHDSDQGQPSDLEVYLVFGALIGLSLIILTCRAIRPHQRRMFECALGALWIGIFGTLLAVNLHAPWTCAALPILLGITWISYLLLSGKCRRSMHAVGNGKDRSEGLSETSEESAPTLS